jgi:hypothetical protein
MMSESRYSLVFDHRAVAGVFRQIGKRELVLAILARLTPEPSWEDTLVYEGQSPLEEGWTVCIGTCGPAADVVQERIVEALESFGIQVLQAYEGGPEERGRIARVASGHWASA